MTAPAPRIPAVVIGAGQLEILEKVYFKTGSSKLQKRSWALLDNVAAVMNAHPEIEKIRVEGHSDSTGNLKFNMRLSKARANTVVRYLVGRGKVDATRLVSEGYGPTRPIVPDAKTKEELEILHRMGRFALEDGAAIAAQEKPTDHSDAIHLLQGTSVYGRIDPEAIARFLARHPDPCATLNADPGPDPDISMLEIQEAPPWSGGGGGSSQPSKRPPATSTHTTPLPAPLRMHPFLFASLYRTRDNRLVIPRSYYLPWASSSDSRNPLAQLSKNCRTSACVDHGEGFKNREPRAPLTTTASSRFVAAS